MKETLEEKRQRLKEKYKIERQKKWNTFEEWMINHRKEEKESE